MDFDRPARKHKIRAAVMQRFDGACAYCGKVPRVLTLDHIVAKSKGGFDVKSNLVAVCRPCNNSKRSRELWEWWQSSPWWDAARAKRLSEEVLVCRRR